MVRASFQMRTGRTVHWGCLPRAGSAARVAASIRCTYAFERIVNAVLSASGDATIKLLLTTRAARAADVNPAHDR